MWRTLILGLGVSVLSQGDCGEAAWGCGVRDLALNPGSAFPGCVASGKLINLSVPLFLHVKFEQPYKPHVRHTNTR